MSPMAELIQENRGLPHISPELGMIAIPSLDWRVRIHKGGDAELGINDDLENTSQKGGQGRPFKTGASESWLSATYRGQTSSKAQAGPAHSGKPFLEEALGTTHFLNPPSEELGHLGF